VAQAVVEERQLLKALRWYDGFVVALANPGFLLGSLGFSMGALGVWGAVVLWGISMFLGVLQNWVYSETAAMFPEKPGGIALYAHEGWRRYFSLVGPVATFGYWFAWSSVLAIFGLLIGTLVKAQWFSDNTWSWDYGTGTLPTLGIEHFIGAAVIILVWLFNILGVRPTVWVAYATGALLMIPLAVFIIVPYLTGDWTSDNLQWTLNDGGLDWGGWKLALVWLYIMGWSAYGVETCAAFAPEYKDTVRDTSLALRSAALFSLAVYVLLPLGLGGSTGIPPVDDQGGTFYISAFDELVGGGATHLMVLFLIASLVLSMNTATADGSRALYGIARDGMTIRELYHLNRFHVPARAMTVDMLVNLALLFFVGSILAILVAGNLGYMSAHFFALTGFLLLRKDRPNWPRPIRLAAPWVGVAALLAAANALLIIVGASNPSLTGYGGEKEMWIGVGVLLFSIVLFLFRRLVQDRSRVVIREETPQMPTAEARAPAAPTTGY
jgi:amino acid transporter